MANRPVLDSIGIALARGQYVEAAALHPLAPQLATLVQRAMRAVRLTRLHGKTTLASKTSHVKSLGCLVGCLFEYHVSRLLTTHCGYAFEAQRKKMDCDIVCHDAPILSFELKTTTHSRDIVGNRSATQSTKEGSFLLAVNYDSKTLTVRSVRFGWVDCECWIPQNGTGQRSRLSTWAQEYRMMPCL